MKTNCPNCGSPVEYIQSESLRCPSCGTNFANIIYLEFIKLSKDAKIDTVMRGATYTTCTFIPTGNLYNIR